MGKCRLAPIAGKKWLQKERPLQWFNEPDKYEPSPTEKRIAKTLTELGINYHREVCFRGLLVNKTYYRFDFWIPKYRTIIEYDGKHHLDPEFKVKDAIKDNFLRKYSIKLVRFNVNNYYTLEQDIKNLFK